MKTRNLVVAGWSALLVLVGTTATADPIPADPDSKFNQMMTDCMTRQDPAMNKEDAIKACQEKWKQGIKVKKPKKKEKPQEQDKPNDTPHKS